jgi:hypothetical protein
MLATEPGVGERVEEKIKRPGRLKEIEQKDKSVDDECHDDDEDQSDDDAMRWRGIF